MFHFNNIKCCESCWHSPLTPCHDFIDCLNSAPLCEGHLNCSEKLLKKFSGYRYETIQKPVIFIGAGTCGITAGADKTKYAIEKYLEENKIDGTIIEVGCIGMCYNEPIVDIQLPGKTRISFKKITEDKVNELLDTIFNNSLYEDQIIGQHRNELFQSYNNIPYLDELPFFKNQKRLILKNCGITNPSSIEEYLAHDGFKALSKTLKTLTQSELCDIISLSGLRDRDWNSLTTGEKWKNTLNNEKKEHYLICNADESDPDSFMNRSIIEGNPYILLEGISIAAYSIGANTAYIYISTGHSQAIKRLENAIEDCRKIGLNGNNILDSGFSLEIVIEKWEGAFLCGKDTTLINGVEGKRGLPRWISPNSNDRGLFGKPTVVNNVETLAIIPEIVLNGSKWFNSIGTKTSKGTKVFALSGHITNPSLIEVEFGTSLDKIINEIGCREKNGKPLKTVQIGGPFGGLIPNQKQDIEIDFESLQAIGIKMLSGLFL